MKIQDRRHVVETAVYRYRADEWFLCDADTVKLYSGDRLFVQYDKRVTIAFRIYNRDGKIVRYNSHDALRMRNAN